jgi:hypothetical protein
MVLNDLKIIGPCSLKIFMLILKIHVDILVLRLGWYMKMKLVFMYMYEIHMYKLKNLNIYTKFNIHATLVHILMLVW